jgi:predicted DNA-binding transcriptional regulator AlpA
MQKVFLTFADLKELGIAYSRSHIKRLIEAGQFPNFVRLGSGSKTARMAWAQSDVYQWMEERMNAAGTPTAPNFKDANASLKTPAPVVPLRRKILN